MIDFICGKLENINDNNIIIENNGIGFFINFPKSSIYALPNIGEEIKVYTYMQVKEDDISLYGFLNILEKEMFLKLITVNGVGPKGALFIISTLGVKQLVKAILTSDSKCISSVQGIGLKTASKICIDLCDKVKKMNLEGIDEIDISKELKIEDNEIEKEVIEALITLGYKKKEAVDILSKIENKQEMTEDELLKQALKKK